MPCAIPETNPLALIVATAVFEEIQALVAAGSAVLANCVVCATHTFNVPVMTGNGFTVTVAVTIQPFAFVKVMIVVPPETPVTTPLLFTVATAVLDEVHGVTVAGVAVLANAVVEPAQTFSVPVIVGSAVTVTTAVVIQPFEFV